MVFVENSNIISRIYIKSCEFYNNSNENIFTSKSLLIFFGSVSAGILNFDYESQVFIVESWIVRFSSGNPIIIKTHHKKKIIICSNHAGQFKLNIARCYFSSNISLKVF